MIDVSKMSQDTKACISACLDCHELCKKMVIHCLRQGGAHAEPGHVEIMLDCAEICQMSAHFMLRGSPLLGRTCEVCAEVCDRCASECDRFDDERTNMCAEVCRACAEACRDASPVARAA
ncbi:four-helix bundle copper-binding protein [Sorangium sp. So ce426]|uniref:four-helix bundle copper-binding protein n=1 Tax=unclassified Sorangium TaxID=2621164 RepID=UPI003F5BA112